MNQESKTIRVDYLARVEGEGALLLKVRDAKVVEAQLRIFEPPRFFEAFLRGRHYREAPDITARICGICPVAYQMSTVQAVEDALGVEVEEPLQLLRRLLYCGEWIESHMLHVHMLHAPDFLGYDDVVQMAADHPEVVQRGLRLKKTGNRIISLLGGREIHPINVKVGGFYKLPSRQDLDPLAESLKRARDEAIETVRWTARLPFPKFSQDYEFVALSHPSEYPMGRGRLISNRGLNIPVEEYETHFSEIQVPYSNALHSVLKGETPYLVGPMARYNLNFDRLSPLTQEVAGEVGLLPVCRNPFQSIVIRSLEILYACDEALRIIEKYPLPGRPSVEVEPQSGMGFGCTEAPRGILYHRFHLDSEGKIQEAKIIPPTSQNQKRIEEDLRQLVPAHLHLDQEELTWRCEQAIRNYDPCISCATHFLKIEMENLP